MSSDIDNASSTLDSGLKTDLDSRWSRLARPREGFDALVSRLLEPVDNSSIVFFRIAFGIIMLWEVQRYLNYGWVASEYIDPQYYFPYAGFEWVRPWPGVGMYIHFYALGLLAMCIAAGFLYRVSTVLFAFGITYVFLLDKAHFLNHMYLAVLISFMLIFIPANRTLSVDAWLRPSIRSSTAPTWALVLLVTQLSIVYIYGGLAKLNGDWFRGEPMRTWLADESDLFLVGRWVTDEWFVSFISYSGLLLDLFIVPALLWPKTRWIAVIVLILFHRFNAALFSIGIFPMFATAAIVLFLPPDLPRRVVTRVRSMFTPQHRRTSANRKAGRGVAPLPDAAAIASFSQRSVLQRIGIVCFAAYLAFQLLLPLRHFLHPGNPAWTDQGDRFAWRMMLHSKVGNVTYDITDPQSGTTWEVDPGTYLTSFQEGNMRGQPDMILQFSHFLAEEWRKDGYDDVEVRAQTMISLNAREPQPIVDPTVNLAAEELTLANANWITSLDEQERIAAERRRADGQD